MGVQRVDAPDGRHWTVRRQWAPRLLGRGLRARIEQRRRRRRGKRSGGDAAEAVADSLSWFDEGFVAVVGIVLLVGVFVLLFTLGLPLVLALVDLMVVVALVVGGVVARVLFRRPWTVQASDGAGSQVIRRVVGWAASGRMRDEMAAELARGHVPPLDAPGV
ncbi:MAG: hypothetical protein H0V52_11070 [Acidimicrobiia bacterium]|nr:hypothetical protein [Acidimicrobiia bacterium]